jgi:hypothetical protein
MAFVFYSFCALILLFLIGSLPHYQYQVPSALVDTLEEASEILNASDLDDTIEELFLTKHKLPKGPSLIPYITLGLGLFSAALSVNFYWQRPVDFNDLSTTELVDVLMGKEDVMREMRRRWDSRKVSYTSDFS